MNYEYSASSAQPRLLILLTDELEESVKVVNDIIEHIIKGNFYGSYCKNRFFIIVIGYNIEAQVILSGYLREIDERPLDIKSVKVNVSDRTGGVVPVERKIPIWVEQQNCNPKMENYPKAILMAKSLIQKWLADNRILAPIVIDCSNEAHVEYAIAEIEQLTNIVSRDGQTLFFGTYSIENKEIYNVFSEMPDAWKYRFDNWNVNEEDYHSGMLNRMNINQIISVITFVGGEAAIFGFNEEQ